MEVNVYLSPETALFYTKVAASGGKTLQQVLSDALFLLAGELSMEALQRKDDGV